MTITLNILGIIVVLGILYLMSSNKKDIKKKIILKAFAIQLVLVFTSQIPSGSNGSSKDI